MLHVIHGLHGIPCGLATLARQHKWLKNVLRGVYERKAKTVLQGKMEGIRKRVKPRTTWMTSIEERTGISLHRVTELALDKACPE